MHSSLHKAIAFHSIASALEAHEYDTIFPIVIHLARETALGRKLGSSFSEMRRCRNRARTQCVTDMAVVKPV